ncbi:MAG: tetratricopeptide repeat protein [Bryobacteraceae bacterium]
MTCLAHWSLALAILGGAFPALHSEGKSDKRKSHAAYELGQRADEAGHREEAIGDYSEALAADAGNAAALRARGLDYLAAGDNEKAQTDLEEAVRLQPAEPLGYWARADYFAAIGEITRAIQDYTTAIGMKLERTEVYTGRGN